MDKHDLFWAASLAIDYLEQCYEHEYPYPAGLSTAHGFLCNYFIWASDKIAPEESEDCN
jgi:hypothetical protein